MLCIPVRVRDSTETKESLTTKKAHTVKYRLSFSKGGDPAGIRTQDPYIKSVLLYQLSYGIIKLALVYKMVHSGTERKFNHRLTFVCKKVN